MEFLEAFTTLMQDKSFTKWHEEHPKSYLAHGLLLKDVEGWSIGFYNPDKDTMTSFKMGTHVELVPDEEVFKEGGTVHELSIDSVKVSAHDAEQKVIDLATEKHAGANVLKKIFIIQHVHDQPVWNITFLLSTLKAYNVRIHATSGEVVEEKATALFEFGKPA